MPLTMIFVDNRGVTDPALNLALEEYLLRRPELAEPVLILYANEPSVIVGRNQNVLEEIDPAYVRSQGIHVVRRLSGGGAVYHDLGNLNFSAITMGREDLHNFARFTAPIVRALAGLGLQAELRQRSSLFVQGKKISGNAQYASGNRLLSHGTLLFDSDLEALVRALNPRRIQITSKAVQSVRNQVTNIRPLLAEDLTLDRLKETLLASYFHGEVPVRRLDEGAWIEIAQIAETRYRDWEWNFGRSPRSTLAKHIDTAAGRVQANLVIDKGRLQSIQLAGDAAAPAWLAALAEKLVGVRYDRDALAGRLAGVDLPPGAPSRADLLNLLY